MKKVFAALLAMTLVLSALVIVPAAAEPTNVQREIDYTADAPTIDGVIESGEYGKYSIDSWELGDEMDEEEPLFFTDGNYVLTDDELAIDFYAVWDEENLYMAWEVHTKYDSRLPFDIEDGYMYEYCFVQFLMTIGAPDNTVTKYQTAEWSGDYFEFGMCQRDDDNYYKVCWSVPAVVGTAPAGTDWEYAGSRDDDEQITVYECRLPWSKTGIEKIGNDTQFGLNWAVGAQEYYDNQKGMGLVEYTDGILHGKNADNAVCFTLTGYEEGGEITIDPDKKVPGDMPTGVSGEKYGIDKVNAAISGEDKSLVTDLTNLENCNPKYATVLLLRPLEVADVDGKYLVADITEGNQSDNVITFNVETKPGDVALLVHSAGDGNPGYEDREALKQLTAGESQIYLFGFETKDGVIDTKYSNASVVVIPEDQYVEVPTDDPDDPTDDPDDPSDDPSDDPADDPSDDPADDPSDDPAGDDPAGEETTDNNAGNDAGNNASTDAGTTDNSTAEGDDEGGNSTLIIVIVVIAVVVVGAAVAFVVIKKKKQ